MWSLFSHFKRPATIKGASSSSAARIERCALLSLKASDEPDRLAPELLLWPNHMGLRLSCHPRGGCFSPSRIVLSWSAAHARLVAPYGSAWRGRGIVFGASRGNV